MHIITNTHRDPLGLPTGQVLAPNTPTPVRGWDELKKNAVVAAWHRKGLLKEDGPTDSQGSQFVQPDKAELQAKLDALGAKYDKRSGVAKLQSLLAQAEAELALREKAQAAAIEASGLSAEAWAELPEEEREAQLAAEIEKLQAPQD